MTYNFTQCKTADIYHVSPMNDTFILVSFKFDLVSRIPPASNIYHKVGSRQNVKFFIRNLAHPSPTFYRRQ